MVLFGNSLINCIKMYYFK